MPLCLKSTQSINYQTPVLPWELLPSLLPTEKADSVDLYAAISSVSSVIKLCLLPTPQRAADGNDQILRSLEFV